MSGQPGPGIGPERLLGIGVVQVHRSIHRVGSSPALLGQGGRGKSDTPPDFRQPWPIGHNGPMASAVIVDVVRTPVGKKNGRLSGWHAVDLAAQPLIALIERNDLDPALVEDVVYGCTMTVGEQAMNIGRNAALAAGFPDTVPGTTVDRQCGSAQQAVHFAAQAVASGAMDVVVAAGVEAMSRVPIGSTTDPGPGEAYGPVVHQRFDFIHQGLAAEAIAQRLNISREAM